MLKYIAHITNAVTGKRIILAGRRQRVEKLELDSQKAFVEFGEKRR